MTFDEAKEHLKDSLEPKLFDAMMQSNDPPFIIDIAEWDRAQRLREETVSLPEEEEMA